LQPIRVDFCYIVGHRNYQAVCHLSEGPDTDHRACTRRLSCLPQRLITKLGGVSGLSDSWLRNHIKTSNQTAIMMQPSNTALTISPRVHRIL
jgi:hypothetical protein